MKRKVIGLMAAVSLTVAIGYPANPPAVQWIRPFQPEPWDTIANRVQQTRDNGFILAGFVRQSDTNPDMFLWKTDSLGNTQWCRAYGGPKDDGARSVRQTSDGGYIVAGSGYVNDSLRAILVKTDSLGNQQWRYAGPEFSLADDVVQTRDGGYAFSGHWSKPYSLHLTKLNAQGNCEWSRQLPATYSENWTGCRQAVQQTQDGGFIVTAEALLKTDSLGNLQWKKTYPYVEVINSVQQTPDRGFIATGFGPSPVNPWHTCNVVLLKTDSLGNKVWMRRFRGAFQSAGFCVRQCPDGGYFICAAGSSYGPWLIRTDSQGNLLWTMELPVRGRADEGAPTADGGYIVNAGALIKLAPDNW